MKQLFWQILTVAEHLLMFPGDANLQISSLAEELARKTEDASRQQEEITHLLSQIVDLQKKAKLVCEEVFSLRLIILGTVLFIHVWVTCSMLWRMKS